MPETQGLGVQCLTWHLLENLLEEGTAARARLPNPNLTATVALIA